MYLKYSPSTYVVLAGMLRYVMWHLHSRLSWCYFLVGLPFFNPTPHTKMFLEIIEFKYFTEPASLTIESRLSNIIYICRQYVCVYKCKANKVQTMQMYVCKYVH